VKALFQDPNFCAGFVSHCLDKGVRPEVVPDFFKLASESVPGTPYFESVLYGLWKQAETSDAPAGTFSLWEDVEEEDRGKILAQYVQRWKKLPEETRAKFLRESPQEAAYLQRYVDSGYSPEQISALKFSSDGVAEVTPAFIKSSPTQEQGEYLSTLPQEEQVKYVKGLSDSERRVLHHKGKVDTAGILSMDPQSAVPMGGSEKVVTTGSDVAAIPALASAVVPGSWKAFIAAKAPWLARAAPLVGPTALAASTGMLGGGATLGAVNPYGKDWDSSRPLSSSDGELARLQSRWSNVSPHGLTAATNYIDPLALGRDVGAEGQLVSELAQQGVTAWDIAKQFPATKMPGFSMYPVHGLSPSLGQGDPLGAESRRRIEAKARKDTQALDPREEVWMRKNLPGAENLTDRHLLQKRKDLISGEAGYGVVSEKDFQKRVASEVSDDELSQYFANKSFATGEYRTLSGQLASERSKKLLGEGGRSIPQHNKELKDYDAGFRAQKALEYQKMNPGGGSQTLRDSLEIARNYDMGALKQERDRVAKEKGLKSEEVSLYEAEGSLRDRWSISEGVPLTKDRLSQQKKTFSFRTEAARRASDPEGYERFLSGLAPEQRAAYEQQVQSFGGPEALVGKGRLQKHRSDREEEAWSRGVEEDATARRESEQLAVRQEKDQERARRRGIEESEADQVSQRRMQEASKRDAPIRKEMADTVQRMSQSYAEHRLERDARAAGQDPSAAVARYRQEQGFSGPAYENLPTDNDKEQAIREKFKSEYDAASPAMQDYYRVTARHVTGDPTVNELQRRRFNRWGVEQGLWEENAPVSPEVREKAWARYHPQVYKPEHDAVEKGYGTQYRESPTGQGQWRLSEQSYGVQNDMLASRETRAKKTQELQAEMLARRETKAKQTQELQARMLAKRQSRAQGVAEFKAPVPQESTVQVPGVRSQPQPGFVPSI
jgi:hypothetical protein